MINDEEDEDENPADFLTFRTLKEDLFISWNFLTPEMKQMEAKSAIRSKIVQDAAYNQRPQIYIPRDDELDISLFQNSKSPSRNSSRGGSRSRFGKNNSKVNDFISWWSNVSFLESPTKSIRKNFLLMESFYATASKDILKAFIDSELVSEEELSQLTVFCSEVLQRQEEIFVTPSKVFDYCENELFSRFRSWYKGGFVLRDKFNEENER